MNLQEYAEQEDKRIQAEKQKYQTENNLPGFWIPEIGENRFEIQPTAPRDKDFGEGNRKIFRIKIQTGEIKDWALNPNNPAYTEFIHRIYTGQTKFVMLRTGKDNKTRYEFLNKD